MLCRRSSPAHALLTCALSPSLANARVVPVLPPHVKQLTPLAITCAVPWVVRMRVDALFLSESYPSAIYLVREQDPGRQLRKQNNTCPKGYLSFCDLKFASRAYKLQTSCKDNCCAISTSSRPNPGRSRFGEEKPKRWIAEVGRLAW